MYALKESVIREKPKWSSQVLAKNDVNARVLFKCLDETKTWAQVEYDTRTEKEGSLVKGWMPINLLGDFPVEIKENAYHTIQPRGNKGTVHFPSENKTPLDTLLKDYEHNRIMTSCINRNHIPDQKF